MCIRDSFEGGWLLTAQEDGSIHVADDGIRIILIDRLELTPVSYTHLFGQDGILCVSMQNQNTK